MTSIKRLGLAAITLGVLTLASGRAEAAFVDFTTIPDGTATSYTLGGVTVSGSASVGSGVIGTLRGLGIVGGGSSNSLDLGETMTIDFNQLVSNVSLTIVDVDPPGNILYSFQAFNGANSLGTFAVPAHTAAVETKNLSALDGGLAFTRINLFLTSSTPPIGLQLQAANFTSAVPEPSSLALCGIAGAMGLVVARARRKTRSA